MTLSLFSVATEAQVRTHICWSSAFDSIEGSTLPWHPVPGGRTDRSREPRRARAVRRLGVPVGMGGKANCLCLRGIWETPKPRYREETKPVAKLPGTIFVPKITRTTRACRRDTTARIPRGRGPSEETHLRREARASFARCLGPAVRVRSPSRLSFAARCPCRSDPSRIARASRPDGQQLRDVLIDDRLKPSGSIP